MDTLSLLILAVGTLAFLDIAALNLRGDERSSRSGRSGRGATQRMSRARR